MFVGLSRRRLSVLTSCGPFDPDRGYNRSRMLGRGTNVGALIVVVFLECSRDSYDGGGSIGVFGSSRTGVFGGGSLSASG
eukprot:scaffold2087_cov153-Pinguiococcus_pyrenoidosus.AAC.2